MIRVTNIWLTFQTICQRIHCVDICTWITASVSVSSMSFPCLSSTTFLTWQCCFFQCHNGEVENPSCQLTFILAAIIVGQQYWIAAWPVHHVISSVIQIVCPHPQCPRVPSFIQIVRKIKKIHGFRISLDFSTTIQAKSKEQVLCNWHGVYIGI